MRTHHAFLDDAEEVIFLFFVFLKKNFHPAGSVPRRCERPLSPEGCGLDPELEQNQTGCVESCLLKRPAAQRE